MNAPPVWLVVVNWNGASLLDACVAALTAQTLPAQVVVIDNGSTDASAAVVARHPGVRWIPLGQNTGFAAGCNAGLRRALAQGARWIGLVNPDVVLAPDWLERTVAAGDAHGDVGVVGGLVVFGGDEHTVNSTGLVLDVLGRVKDRDFGRPLAQLRREDGYVDGVSGSAVLLRADALRRIGLFDPAYWAYYEDADLSLRAARAGIRAFFVASARAAHGYGQSFGVGSPLQRYYLGRNHLRLVAAHLPWPRALVLVPTLAVLRAGVKAPLELARGRRAHALAHLRAAGSGFAVGVEAMLGRARRRRIPVGAELDVRESAC